MLVLLSFALVLAATVLLVLGLLNDEAHAHLPVDRLQRGGRGRADRGAASQQATGRGEGAADAAVGPTAVAGPRPRRSRPTAAASPTASGSPATSRRTSEEVDFPIADYDDLTAGRSCRCSRSSTRDEIGVVEARELRHQGPPGDPRRASPQLRGDVPAGDRRAPAAWATRTTGSRSTTTSRCRPRRSGRCWRARRRGARLVRDREMASVAAAACSTTSIAARRDGRRR